MTSSPSSSSGEQTDITHNHEKNNEKQTLLSSSHSSTTTATATVATGTSTIYKQSTPHFTRFQKLQFKIFSPWVLLLFLFIINIFIYFDRGAISAIQPSIEKHWKISKTQQGALSSAFMVGYMLFCPIFAELASRISTSVILAIGLFGWSVMTFACGLSGGSSQHIWGYYMLVTCRCFVGIGEAAFAPIAPTLIDDCAPEKQKTTFMSIFYIALPCGAALGYGVSGLLASRISWRIPFFAEGIIMLVLSLLCLLIPSTEKYKEYQQYKQSLAASSGSDPVEGSESMTVVLEKARASFREDAESQGLLNNNNNDTMTATVDEMSEMGMTREELLQMKKDKRYNIFQAIVALGTNPCYVFAALAATAYTFVVGGLAFWAPTVVADLLDWSPERANLAFSAVCAVTGLFGSFFGGILLDLIGGASGMKGASRAFLLCTIYIGIALPLGTVAFLMRSPVLFFLFLFMAELFVFGITSPMNVAFLAIVNKNLRNFSMSFQIFSIHLLGDVPSPILFGLLADAIGKKKGTLVSVHFLWAVLLLAIIFFFFAFLLTRSKAKRRERIEEHMQAKKEAMTQNQSME